MADTQKAEETPAKETQVEPVPGSEQKTEESTEEQVVAPEKEEALETPAGDSEEPELPKGTSERTTEQFDKIKSQMREWKDKALNLLSKKETPPTEDKPLYDPKTGLVDLQALEALRKDAKTTKEEVARLRQDKADEQANDLYSAHPELRNPKTKEAKEVYDESERIWMHSQAYPDKYGGQSLSQKQAADLAKKRMGEVKKTAKQATEATVAKEAASAEASGRPTQAIEQKQATEEDLEEMRVATRDPSHPRHDEAMLARMKAIRKTNEASE